MVNLWEILAKQYHRGAAFESQLKLYHAGFPFLAPANLFDSEILWLFKMNFSEIMLVDDGSKMAPAAEWLVTGTPAWTRRANCPAKIPNAHADDAGQNKRSAAKISRQQIS
jgi:hypothetical protein